MSDFISIDWGTTSLRVSHCSDGGHTIIRSIATTDGALAVNQRFLAKGNSSPEARKSFFQEVMDEAIEQLNISSDLPLPVLISGMASSAIGMETLPYAHLPFSVDGSKAMIKQWRKGGNTYSMISGLATEDDIMRGEETQLVGAAIIANVELEEALLIFPGTHAKHMVIKNGEVQGFKTYMTGEVFCQMFSNSILAQSVTVHHDHNEQNTSAFLKGVREGAEGNILQTMFRVRTNGMFHRMNKEENFSYLSGMLIGAELKDIKGFSSRPIILCGSGEMMQAYHEALKALGVIKEQKDIFSVDAHQASAVGQYKINELASHI
jgi:2-dehydro-3-deoxygalactonokinase